MRFHLGDIAAVVSVFALTIYVMRRKWRLALFASASRTSNEVGKPLTPAERPLGEWTSVEFQYPHFEPLLDFDLQTTKPIPYRPFKWGPYSVNMGIRPMSWESWVELDNTYLETLAIRKRRAQERGDKAVRTLPGAEKAALEVCTELASYLAKRYPKVIRVTRTHDEGGLGDGDSISGKNAGRVKTVEIIPTGDKWDLDVDDPMHVVGMLAEDLAIMMEGPDGQYYLKAAAICIPGFWRLEDKIGLPLKEIHLRGGVYQFKEKLQLSLDRFFRRLPVDKPVLRNNYFFQVDTDLAWANVHHGDEDAFDQSTHLPHPESLTTSNKNWRPPKPTTDLSRVYFRSERQSLRRMPKTGCICFTIRTYFHPVTEIVKEPGIPGRLASAIRSWPEPIAEARAKELYADTLLPWLDRLHKEQIESGIINVGEEKADRYPF
ncbi:hypothetical protein M422DRAFT_223007 [Sphaerobolus stellatus SS14]|nr:hypothetical protein M422DRAFT_223007 [Sphaerobolus stellatus SS14]